MSRYATTSMTEAAILHAYGFETVGARKLDAEEAREARKRGDSCARVGSIAFEIDSGDDEQAFRDALAVAQTRGGWVHAGQFHEGVQHYRRWIRQFDTGKGSRTDE